MFSVGHCLLFRSVARSSGHYSSTVDALPPEARLKHNDLVYLNSGRLSLFLLDELDLQTHSLNPYYLGFSFGRDCSNWALWNVRLLFPEEVRYT